MVLLILALRNLLPALLPILLGLFLVQLDVRNYCTRPTIPVSAPDNSTLAVGGGRPLVVAPLELFECRGCEISHRQRRAVDAVVVEFRGDGLRVGFAVEADDVYDALFLEELHRVVSQVLRRVLPIVVGRRRTIELVIGRNVGFDFFKPEESQFISVRIGHGGCNL